MKLVLLASLVLACVLAQPANPVWPTSFSAGVHVTTWHFEPNRPAHFINWYYDAMENKDIIHYLRQGRNNEEHLSKVLIDHTAKEEYRIHFQRGLVDCEIRADNNSLPHPRFTNVEYRGEALIDYERCYHWVEVDHERGLEFSYFDRVVGRDPKRIDLSSVHGWAETWTFHHFDKCKQDPNIFHIQTDIMDVCTKV